MGNKKSNPVRLSKLAAPRTTVASLIALCLLVSFQPLSAAHATDDEGEIQMAKLLLPTGVFFRLTNAEGEVLVHDSTGISGTMGYTSTEVISADGEDESLRSIEVEDSVSFAFEFDKPATFSCVVEGKHIFGDVGGTNLSSMSFEATTVGTRCTVTPAKGKTTSYWLSATTKPGDYYHSESYEVYGSSKKMCVLKCGSDGARLQGDMGRVSVLYESPTGNTTSVTRYLFGDADISFLGRRLLVDNSATIPMKTSKTVKNVKLKSYAAEPSGMFLTWNAVKGAKSYRVYRYEGGKWKRVALNKGQWENYYRIQSAGVGKQRYRVRAFKKANGRKPLGKMGYEVSAVSKASATRANAGKVTASKKKLSGRVGRATRLKATVRVREGEARRLLSKKVRWFSSNPKVAKVDRKTGKVRFLKRGKAKIWAKAHNGVNSKKIKVTVR